MRPPGYLTDLSLERAISSLQRTSFPSFRLDTNCLLIDGLKQDKTSDSAAIIATPGIDVILEVTGNSAVGVRDALLCCEHKSTIVLIKVEVDVLARTPTHTQSNRGGDHLLEPRMVASPPSLPNWRTGHAQQALMSFARGRAQNTYVTITTIPLTLYGTTTASQKSGSRATTLTPLCSTPSSTV